MGRTEGGKGSGCRGDGARCGHAHFGDRAPSSPWGSSGSFRATAPRPGVTERHRRLLRALSIPLRGPLSPPRPGLDPAAPPPCDVITPRPPLQDGGGRAGLNRAQAAPAMLPGSPAMLPGSPAARAACAAPR
ncbi:transcription initiation factor TFIID subunit 4-like [Malurus melanocephalus]|uniref:transcription initiation factor TFIID subunit 4-like n=1 Tax=Malurus melanocephalus TaxID=175006 RepID=UPI002548CA4E|nr:transcription initiation factor TFIID subunit 4-like [Malurus melanocephalus]